MTPTPPEGFKIIPREWLEAGNPLPDDTVFWGERSKTWLECPGRGERTWNTEAIHATAQPLPCFQKGGDEPCAQNAPTPDMDIAKTSNVPSTVSASNAPVAVPSPDQEPEHNPDGLTLEQYGAPEWRLLGPSEAIQEGDEYYSRVCGSWEVTGNAGGNWTPSQTTENLAYRRRVAPAPTPGSTPRTGTVMDCMVGGQEGLNTHPAAEQARNNTLNKLAYEQSGEPRTECTQGQRIAELERERDKLRSAGKILADECDSLFKQGERVERERDEARAEAKEQNRLLGLSNGRIYWLEDDAVKLRAQLASEKDHKWQPIETAPKDGTRVMIYTPDMMGAVETGFYHEFTIPPGWCADTRGKPRSPTHWMPLPKAPDAAMKEAK